MGQLLVLTAPKKLAYEALEHRPLNPKEVRVRTLYSGISAGTELAAYRGTSPFLHKRWDAERRLFVPFDAPEPQYPLRSWGYEEVGEVIECGAEVTSLKEGDVVYGTWGHRTHHIAEEAYAAPRLLPGGLEPILGIYSHIGPIALNGILDAGIRIGETVAVFGLGVLGQVVAQLAKRSGARVIGVDVAEGRLELARELGSLDEAIAAASGGVGERIKDLTGGRGVDVALEVSGSTAALHEAIRACAYAAKVVAMGFFQGEAKGLFLGEEFHHNRIQLVCSQIGGVAPERSHRWDRLRLVHTTMRLQAEGVLDLRRLITHTYPFTQAAEAFARLDALPAHTLQVVLDFNETSLE